MRKDSRTVDEAAADIQKHYLKMISEAKRHVEYGFSEVPGSMYSIEDVVNLLNLPWSDRFSPYVRSLLDCYKEARNQFANVRDNG